MTKKAQTPTVPSGNPDPNTLQLSKDPAQTDAAQIAAMKQRYPALADESSLELSARVAQGEMKW